MSQLTVGSTNVVYLKHGETITIEEPTKTGYAFAGWLLDNEPYESNVYTFDNKKNRLLWFVF